MGTISDEKSRGCNLEFCILVNNGRIFGIKKNKTIEISRNGSQIQILNAWFFL